jgi:aspartate 1-decarboxylase
MNRHMLLGKIHRATVTGAELHYEGSVTIDRDLLDQAGILPYERVDIWNVTNGERFTTYTLSGRRGSGVVCINGAAAHKARRGDLVIIAAFAEMSEVEARDWQPRAVFVDERNRPTEKRPEIGGQVDGEWESADGQAELFN